MLGLRRPRWSSARCRERSASGATLAELGYNVVEAASGDQAVQVFASRPGRFSAVLLGRVMQGMTGLKAFQAMTAVRPDVPVIVVTGYAAESHIDDTMKRQMAGLLQKPFKVEEICDTLLSVGAGHHGHGKWRPSRPGTSLPTDRCQVWRAM